jgi:hypothetical protein
MAQGGLVVQRSCVFVADVFPVFHGIVDMYVARTEDDSRIQKNSL